ncbi:2,3-diaminopropionate biosynthesis protein SbnA [Bremerella alba]
MITANAFHAPVNCASHTRPTVAKGILEAIGSTPLVQLTRFLDRNDVTLYAKLESQNPGGSAKDRPALQMLREAIESGKVNSDTTIVESSSGNMGIGLAQACRYYGLRFVCVVDPRAQAQNLAIIKALGSEIEQVTTPIEGDFLAARLARVDELLEQLPNSYWPNQYANTENPKAHELGTIREIDETLDGTLDYLFVATSSTGTIQGCRNYLRARGRNTQVVAVDATGSVLFGGTSGRRMIPGLGAGREPALARHKFFKHVHRVTDLDCVIGCRRAATKEAMLIGGSAGGVLEAIRSAQNTLLGKTCVAILHDSGARYLDTVFNDQWVQQELGISPDDLEQMTTSNVSSS